MNLVISGARTGGPAGEGSESTGMDAPVYRTVAFFSPSNHRISMGYMLHPEFWGMGYATKAVVAATTAWWADYAGVRTSASEAAGSSLWAETIPGNALSSRVLVKSGFVKVEEAEDEYGPYELWRLDAPDQRS